MSFEPANCAVCGEQIKDTGVSDEAAMAESKAIFGEVPADQLDVVCDKCFEELKAADPWLAEQCARLRVKH